MSDDCLFCKIAKHEISATLVYEDDEVLAFEDISPQAPFHVLVIPRKHISTLNDLTPDDTALTGSLITRATQIAKDKGHAEEPIVAIGRQHHIRIVCGGEYGEGGEH